eukprot:TRINITY_DN773036_c0_g1_i1.p1 TRINITY_DN773036_c0_g1~~TRINITY_DN773036_c0_g1_i1.p1  ORF type:complete len:151 (-),score=28.54 TRINITY_DN773036_c0_g1_i1:263-715(-)
MSTIDVFLGGTCNPTTWRKEIAIPILEEAKVTYYNPQIDEWCEELIDIEQKMKDKAECLLFVIGKETRGIVSMIEATELITIKRNVFLVCQLVDKEALIDNEVVGIRERQDLNRGRSYLLDVAKRHNIKVFDNVCDATKAVCTHMKELGL